MKQEKVQEEFEKVAKAFAGAKDVTLGGGKGFGSGALKVKGKIFAMTTSKAEFVVKLPAARAAELVVQGHGNLWDAGRGHPMKEWLDATGRPERWLGLAREAERYVRGR